MLFWGSSQAGYIKNYILILSLFRRFCLFERFFHLENSAPEFYVMIDYVLLNNVNRNPRKNYIFRKNFEKPEKAVYREFSIMSLFQSETRRHILCFQPFFLFVGFWRFCGSYEDCSSTQLFYNVRRLETLTSETFQSARRLLSKTMIAQNYHARYKN